MTKIRRDARLLSVPAPVRPYVTRLAREHGPREAGRKRNISRDAAVGMTAALDVTPGTLGLVRESMAKAKVAR